MNLGFHMRPMRSPAQGPVGFHHLTAGSRPATDLRQAT